MVLQLLDAELAATADPRAEGALLFEKAHVLAERLDRVDDALATVGALLDGDPREVGLLVQASALAAAHGDVRLRLRAQRQLAATLPDPELAAHALQAAAVLHARAGEPEEALARWREAFALDRSDPVTLGALRSAAEDAGDDAALSEILAAEAERGGPGAAPAYVALARAYVRLGRPEDAVATLVAARHRAPRDVRVLSALAAMHEALGHPEELADVLAAHVDLAHDESEWLALQLRLAALLEDALHRDAQAVQRYRAVLARVPGHAAALAGLGRIHAKTQAWPELVAVYDAELAAAPDARARAELHFRCGDLLDARLRRTDEALGRFREALQLVPGYLPARQALERVLKREGRWAELLAVREEELLSITDPLEAVVALGRIAREAEEHLGDLEAASDALRRALELIPTHAPSLLALTSLAERRGAWSELVALLRRQADLSPDAGAAVALRHRAAQVLEERLSDAAGAAELLRTVLESEPRYVPALQALGRLYAREGKWSELRDLARREADLAPPARAAQLWTRVAELEETRLGDATAARAAWDEVLRHAPSDDAALRAVARMQRDAGDWEGLVATLRRAADARTDARGRAEALWEVATTQLDLVEDRAGARETLETVLRLAPDHAPALRELERLAPDGPERLLALERATQVGSEDERLAATLRLAQALAAAGQLDRAAALAEAALELDPGHLGALVLLEQVRAQDRARRTEARERLAEQVPDPALASALHLAAQLDEPRARLETRIERLRRAFALDPEDLRTAFHLERALRQAGDAEGLRALYERRLAVVDAPSSRLELWLRLGQLAESADDRDRALAAYQAALALEPAELVALQGLRRVRTARGEHDAAALAAEAEAAATPSREGAADAWRAAGRTWLEAVGDPDRALEAFERALALDPHDAETAEAMEGLLARRGGALELAELHERRGRMRLASGDRPGAAMELFKAAQGWLDSVGDAERARAAVARALEAEPEHPDALELRAELALEAGAWEEAAEALEARLRVGGDAEAVAALQLRLGVLLQDRLDAPARAVAAFSAALAAGPSAEALDRLATLHRASGNWTAAVDCLEELRALPELTPEARARASLRLAEVLDIGFADVERALEAARAALPLAKDDPSVLERIVPLFERRNRLSTLVQALETLAAEATSPAARAGLEVRLAELLLRSVGDLSRAVSAFRTAVAVDPTSVQARAGLASALARDPGSAELAVDSHREVLALDPAHAGSLEALLDAWERQAASDRAFCAASVLVFLQGGPARAMHRHMDWRARVPSDAHARVDGAALTTLLHPDARNPLTEVLAAVGGHVSKLFPPAFETLQIDRRSDRLRDDHPLHRAIRLVAETFGVDEFDVYQARRGLMVAETTEPLSICVGQDVVRRFNSREQKFLMGRAVFALLTRTALLGRLSEEQVADFLGDCVRTVEPAFDGLGTADAGRARTLRRLLPRRALRALESPARALVDGPVPDVARTVQGLLASANRAGLLMAGDPAVALSMVLREDPAFATARADSTEGVAAAVRSRADLRALVPFAVSEAFFELRRRVGPGLER